MSLHMNAGMARLTVLGTGWSNTAIDSGDGYTADGQLWHDIATELNYDFGDDVDWDLIAETELPDFDWSDVIYTDPDGNIYTDPDGDGIWTNPLTDLEYPGGGDMWVPEDDLIDLSDGLDELVTSDSSIAQYNIPNDVIPSLFGGKVGAEIQQTSFDSDRPHYYTPPVWYLNQSSGVIFSDEPFFHGTASGGSITVYDEAITIRDGSSKEVYWSSCSTLFFSGSLPSPYNSYPTQYVCWQCLYGSLSDALIGANPNTVTSEDIRNGDSDLPTINYDGETYYKTTR